QLTLRVQAGLQNVARGWAIEIVADIVLARPDDLNGRAGIAGNERGFNGVILEEAAATSTADERDMHFDMVARNTESAGDRVSRGSWNLRRRPKFTGISAHVGGAIDGLHGGMREERHFVDSFDSLCSRSMSLVEVAVVADHRSRFGSEAQHFLAQAGG